MRGIPPLNHKADRSDAPSQRAAFDRTAASLPRFADGFAAGDAGHLAVSPDQLSAADLAALFQGLLGTPDES